MISTRLAVLLVGASAAAGLVVGAAGTLRANDGGTSIPQQCIEYMQSWGSANGPGMMGGSYGMGPGMMGSSYPSMVERMREHGVWTTPEVVR